MAEPRSGIRVSAEQAGNWGGYGAVAGRGAGGREQHRQGPAVQPATSNPQPLTAVTGIELTEAERQAALMGAAGKTAWMKAAESFYRNSRPAQYRGRTLLAIARTFEGLNYLGWLLKKMQHRQESSAHRDTLETFFADERVQRALVDRRGAEAQRTAGQG